MHPVGTEAHMIRDSKLSELQGLVVWMVREISGLWIRVWVNVLLLVTLTGCTARLRPNPLLPTVNIPPECASSIHMKNCDLSVSPPRCRTVAINYRPGCEQIMVDK